MQVEAFVDGEMARFNREIEPLLSQPGSSGVVPPIPPPMEPPPPRSTCSAAVHGEPHSERADAPRAWKGSRAASHGEGRPPLLEGSQLD